jgi:histidyl-tRNA synthetase
MNKPQIISPKTPTGTMELLPREQAAFQSMLDTVRRAYERHGFVQIETPVFEEANILLTKSGGETEKQVYFVQSTGSLAQGNKPDMALRFDLTVPLARYVAEHEHNLAFPFRRYQIQRVYRGERAQKGRFREFYQCDIDIIGKDALSPAYDAEVPVVIADIFRELKIGKFTINVSNRKILKGLMGGLEVSLDDQMQVLREIDKVDKIGWGEVKKNIFPFVDQRLDFALDAMQGDYSNVERLSILRHQYIGANAELHEGLAEIELLLKTTADMGAGDVIKFNPAITRGLDYYTGTVYETFLDEHKGFGSICSGGRYDNLASHYTKSKLPGVGISIGLTRLFDQMRHAGLIKEPESSVKILVAYMSEATLGHARKAATDLRKAGVNTALYLEPHKLEKQIKYAERSGIPHMLLIGEDEAKRGEAAFKTLATREQKSVKLDQLAGEIGKLVL